MYNFVGHADYYFLAAAAFWGLFCAHMIWTQIGRIRYKNEAQQQQFLDSVSADIAGGNFEQAEQTCEGNPKALAMLVSLALKNRELDTPALQELVLDRFQYDILAQIEARVNWVTTIIKLAPMLGLIGTVAGMMGAFETLETATTSEPTKQLLADIRMALEHTLMGLLITVTLLVVMGVVNNRIKDMEELVAFGLNRFFEDFEQGKKSAARVRR
ncbi:MAG: MotA/TolQ/ExbB proton channel family protein [Pirellulales bacterium]